MILLYNRIQVKRREIVMKRTVFLAAVALSLLLASCGLESATGGADAASGTY